MTIAVALILILVGLGLLSTFPFSRVVATGRLQAIFRIATVALLAMAFMGEGMWLAFGR